MEVGQALRLIAGIIVVILAAYYATYYLAKRRNKRIPGRGINVLERFSLTKDKLVCVIEANGKEYLVVITNGGATLLDTFEAGEYEAEAAENDMGTAKPQQHVYKPNGIIATAIWKIVNSAKSASTAKTAAAQRNTDMSARQPDLRNDAVEYPLRTVREEDGIDEIQRRLKNRKTASFDVEEAPKDE